MKKNPSVCVIGAGCSGITAVKNLLQAGVQDVVCFERNSDIGGNWIYSASPSYSSVCETTHIISSKTMSAYSDFPMPNEYPDYPSHTQVLAYFRSYAKHFGLYPYIQFNTSVEKVEKLENEQWLVELGSGKKHIFDYLLIANGHHAVPRLPEGMQDQFTGTFLHSHSYKTNQPFKNQRVLVVGSGNSGCDCAVEISRVAEQVDISIRNPNYIIPKFFLGRPTDTFNENLQFLPKFIVRFLQKITLRIQLGKYEDYGLETPPFSVTKSHPTLNSELLYKIRHGKVTPRKGIEKIKGKLVQFTDGTSQEYDTIIAATGYKISTPFFDKDFINYEEADRIPLYLRMFHAEHPSLIFIGLVQPQGAIWPLSDQQSKLAANYIMDRWKRPENLKDLAEKDADYIDQEFVKAKRHTIEVHFHPYLKQLKKETPKNAPEWEDKWEVVDF